MQCPICKLVNPPTAEHCDCGYSFVTQTIDQPTAAAGLEQLARSYRRLAIAAGAQLLFVVLLFLIGPLARIGVAISGLVVLWHTAALLMQVQDGPHRGRAPSRWLVPLMLFPCINLFVLIFVDKFVRSLFAENGVEMGLLGPTQNGLRHLRQIVDRKAPQ